MDLDLYLDMRQVTAYEQLWDDVARQFTQHGDIYLLEKAMDAMGAMRQTQALSASNAEKCSSLEATVVEALRGLFDDIDANNATPLDEDALQKFDAWLARLCLILKHWDMTAALRESTSGSQASLLEAIKQLVERGQMGFHEEEKVGILSLPCMISSNFDWSASLGDTTSSRHTVSVLFVENHQDLTKRKHSGSSH